MTYQEILKTDKLFLTPEDVSEVLGCKAYSINCQVREDPSKIGFPVSLIGTRVRIPRLGFLAWMSGLTPTMEVTNGLRDDDAAG